MPTTRAFLPLWCIAFRSLLLLSVACGANAEGASDVTGGTKSALTSAGGAETGGAPSHTFGGATGTGAASSITSNACSGYDYCVADCFDEYPQIDSALCVGGVWTCGAGHVLASSCPERACGSTRDGCCNLSTGIATDNQCKADRYRARCPDGTVESPSQWCIPDSVQGHDCASIDGQSCSAPEVQCRDTSAGEVTCVCSSFADAATSTWHCNFYLGP